MSTVHHALITFMSFSCGYSCDDALPVPECDTMTDLTVRTNQYCGLIADLTKSNPFLNCITDPISRHQASLFYDNCVFDTCAHNPDLQLMKRASCVSLLTLSELCAITNNYVPDWRMRTGCSELDYSIYCIRKDVQR